MKNAIAAALAAAVLAASCSQAAPRIDSVSLRLTYRSGGNERLSFFALSYDEDGTLDLEELHLLNDRAQLYWTVTSKDWIVVEQSGETWIGSHGISMPDGASFPRGAYRAVLVDKGGDRAEREIFFDPPAAARRQFPSLAVSDGRYRVVSTYQKNSMVAYDVSGARIRVFPLKTKEGRIVDLSLGQSAQSIALWAEDEEAGVAALTDPVSLKGLY
jgi:hypothetical protein